MIALQFRFLSGRYHATAWGTAVNEGDVEWPPSPWRVLRALLAVWRHKIGEEAVTERTMRMLVAALAEQPPSYALPASVSSHTRQYQPTSGSPKLVIDGFVDVRDRPTFMVWPELELDDACTDALRQCVAALSYLGRAESWVEASLVDAAPPCNVHPTTADDAGASVKRLCPQPTSELAAWTASQPAKKKSEAPLPADVFDALQASTTALQKEGWSRPPGTEWAFWRMPDATSDPRRARVQAKHRSMMNLASYALASAVLPPMTDAISVCDRLHSALVSRHNASVFTGCDAAGVALEGHAHAHIFAEPDLRRPDRIARLTVYAPMGLDELAIRAIEGVYKLWGRDGHDVHLALLDVARVDQADAKDATPTLFRKAREWVSLTPFVSTRHGKSNKRGEPKLDPANGLQIGSPAHDLRRLLVASGFHTPVTITEMPTCHVAGKDVAWHRYNTQRNGGGRRAARVGRGYRLLFDEPVNGPIAVGFSAHFGLGLFVPVDG